MEDIEEFFRNGPLPRPEPLPSDDDEAGKPH
jgi:hypothetical protein